MTDVERIALPGMLLADGRVLTWTGVITAAPQPPPPPPDPQPEPEPPTPPVPTRRSRLTWDSGVFANDKTMPSRFGAMRRRPVDFADVHCEASDVGNPYWLRDYTPASVGGLMLSCPLTPGQAPADYERAGRAMRERGFTGRAARLRPGVELNLDNESRATDGTVDAWIGRFRAAAAAFRRGAGAGAVVCLCVNEGEGSRLIGWDALQRLVDQLLRDGADELGVDLYDQWPPSPTLAVARARIEGGRGSLGWWADFAGQRGAKISVPEWGVARNDGGQWAGHAGGDNPVFIQAMIEWFRANAARIGCESYFAEPASYVGSDLTTQMPRSRAAYIAALR